MAENNQNEFYGVVIGTGEYYFDKAYPLDKKVPVYFNSEYNQIVLEDYSGQELLACLYYIPEYQEYCIEPYQTKTIYLKSGQPLGKRVYYLPRGMSIYINEKSCMFKLG